VDLATFNALPAADGAPAADALLAANAAAGRAGRHPVWVTIGGFA